MKKGVLLIIALLCISLVLAQDELANSQNDSSDLSKQKIDKAYQCLTDKVQGKCGSLSLEEQIFSTLAIGECANEVTSAMIGDHWETSSGSKLKITSQAILALSKTSKDTKKSEDWLLSQTTSPEGVNWYLQIDSSETSSCNVIYDGTDHNLVLNEDKTLSGNTGQCLILSNDDFWLKVSPGCYDREFQITCDKDFKTSLFFKQTKSNVIHVSSDLHSAAANGKTSEKIESKCFMESAKCDYEGSLWASMILSSKGHDMSAFLPYLTTMAEENPRYFPQSFLYPLTGNTNYRNDLLIQQIDQKYWERTGDKFYDTAVVLQSISDEPLEKQNTKAWLLQIQDDQGCWQGNIRNTAFLLSSIWPTYVESTQSECESSGYYCGSESTCAGNILSDYICPGIQVCCDSLPVIKTCSEQGGSICASGETCQGGTSVTASNKSAGEICCVQGTCAVQKTLNDCEIAGGTCRTACSSGETSADYPCDFVGDFCCFESNGGKSNKQSYWWIWFLLILIILTALGIIFKDKLRPFWYKLVSKFKKSGGSPAPSRPGPRPPGAPGLIPSRPNQIMRRTMPRPQPIRRPRPPIRPKPQNNPSDLDKVLGKLKSMGKK